MSRNFELLRGAELEPEQPVTRETSISSAAAAAATPSPAPLTIPSDAQSRIPAAVMGPEVFSLVERLFLTPNEFSPRCVLFISFGGSESGSVCARTAEALSGCVSGNIAVVDANFSSPVMHTLYSIDNSVGFSDALLGTHPLESCAHGVPGSKLTIIPAGTSLRAPKTSPALDSIRQRLDDLRSRFDYVLIDAPADLTMCGALTIGHLCDGAVLVLEANQTRREVARSAVMELNAARVRVLGAVLNDRHFPIPQRIYQAL
jgi:protein-tyrosine kinase